MKNKKILLVTIFICVLLSLFIVVQLLLNVKEKEYEYNDVFWGRSLNVVANIDAEPYSFIREGKVYGHDIDVIYRISEKLGATINLRLMPWKEAQSVMREGKADILLGVDDSLTQTIGYNYSFPLNDDIFVAFGKTDFSYIGNLRNKRIAVVDDSNSIFNFILPYALEKNIQQFDNYKSAFDAVNSGMQDVVVCRYAVGKSIIEHNTSMKGIQPVGPALVNHCICIGVNKEKPELLAQINTIIQEMHFDGTLDSLSEKWLGKYIKITSISMFFSYYKTYIYCIFVFILLLLITIIFLLNKKIVDSSKKLMLDEKVISYFTHKTDMVYIKWDFESKNIIEVINGEILPEFIENGKFTFSTRMAYKNDIQRCEIMFNSLFSGVLVTDFIFKRHTPHGEIKYFLFSGSAFCGNEDSIPTYVVGALKCIDDTVKESKSLQENETADALTGVYRQQEGEKYITKYLEYAYPSTCNAIFIIDIDYFRMINEKYGRLYGDIAIVKVAEILKLSFRASDIIYRLSGDIFIVLMKDCPSREFAALKAKTICNKSNAIYLGEGKEPSVSVSIGISFYPECGTSFEDLFKRAHTALDTAKQQGRNSFSLS